MQYWILKSEPSTYSLSDLFRDGKTCWDGIRNYQARNNLRLMKPGDRAVFYHSGEERAAVGLAEIKTEAYQDPKTKDNWSAVDIAPVRTFKTPITLAQMKADALLKNMVLVKNSRLSVCPLTAEQFEKLVKLAERAE